MTDSAGDALTVAAGPAPVDTPTARDAPVASDGPASPRPTFVVNTPIRDLSEYRRLAVLVKRLKRHGHVEVNISALAEKARHDVPAGGSPWHEYAACNPSPARFFPDPKIAPFVPPDFVRSNSELLLAKARILRELGLGAAFWSYEPSFLPEAFFEAYPALRGPRTDHPRRSRAQAFAPCVDLPETREMITRMVAELVSRVPELGTFFFKTNDAGPGLCWSDWQYTGANGPSACRHRPMDQRVRGLLESILKGGEQAGAKLTVHMTGNFSEQELRAIQANLPANAYVRENGRHSVNVGSCADLCYPVRGILDLVGTLRALQPLQAPAVRTVFLDLRSHYDRGYERLDTSEKLVEAVDLFLAEPRFGTLGLYESARRICERWAGPELGEELFETMVALHEALEHKRSALPRVSAIYGGVSLRYITRPLLVLPERLTEAEEAYFLPQVFNASHERARVDYIDVHGTRHVPEWMGADSADPRVWAIGTVRARLEAVARRLERLEETPDGGHWRKMACSIRLYGSILRSCGNFFAMQILRDRNQWRFDRGRQQPPAQAGPGDPEFLLINEILRDELDNATEAIALLREGGLEIISHADRAEDEDTFLLGPDLVSQIERKCALMLAHWADAEDCFVTPNK